MTTIQDLKEFYNNTKQIVLATSTPDGKPNAVATTATIFSEDSTIWIINNYFDKTMKNFLENNQVSIVFWRDAIGYQVKGHARYFTEEEVSEKAKEWQINRKPGAIVKPMLEIPIEEVYSITPKPGEAGKRLI